MKINNKVYRSLQGEPFLVQDVNNKKVEFFYMNDTPYLSQYVSRGRFYIWTSDGNNYRLLIEKGFYEKVSYFFAEEINTIWLGFLDDIGTTNKKLSLLFFSISIGVSTLIMILVGILWPQQLSLALIAALLVVFMVNIIHTTRVNKIIREKNIEAQTQIRDILTDEGFAKLVKDQEEYMREYFEFENEENNEDNDLKEIEDIEYEAEIVENENEEK